MGYIIQYNRQYLQIIGYIKQKLRNILGKLIGYIWQKLWVIFVKTMGYFEKLWFILGKNYGIYLAKTIGYIMEYI